MTLVYAAIMLGMIVVIMQGVIARFDARTSTKRMIALEKLVGAVHALVNNSLSNQLVINMSVARRIADLTGNPEDRNAASLAERTCREHQVGQQTADDRAADEKGR